MSDESDELLIARIRRGEAAAWEECIARFEGRLLAFVESRLRNRAASEDVVQESFLGFLLSLPNYDDKTSLETWLFSITAHKLTDALRREGRRPAIPLTIADSESGAGVPAARTRRASSLARSGERRTVEQKVIGNCLGELITSWQANGEYERLRCMELLLVLGWQNKSVAERLGISEQAVANHKHFVVAKLKDAATRARLRNFDLAEFGVRER
jgi:RNA polymerase sigma-70 factor (ECF subfamily)